MYIKLCSLLTTAVLCSSCCVGPGYYLFGCDNRDDIRKNIKTQSTIETCLARDQKNLEAELKRLNSQISAKQQRAQATSNPAERKALENEVALLRSQKEQLENSINQSRNNIKTLSL